MRSCAPCQSVCICARCAHKVRSASAHADGTGILSSPPEVAMAQNAERESIEVRNATPSVCDECDERLSGCSIFICQHCTAFHMRSNHLKHHTLSTGKRKEGQSQPLHSQSPQSQTKSLLEWIEKADERHQACMEQLLADQAQQVHAQTQQLRAQVDHDASRSSLLLASSSDDSGSPSSARIGVAWCMSGAVGEESRAMATMPAMSPSRTTSAASSLPASVHNPSPSLLLTDDESAASTVDLGPQWRIETPVDMDGPSGRESEGSGRESEGSMRIQRSFESKVPAPGDEGGESLGQEHGSARDDISCLKMKAKVEEEGSMMKAKVEEEGSMMIKTNGHGISCLHYACIKADVCAVRTLLKSQPAMMWQEDTKGKMTHTHTRPHTYNLSHHTHTHTHTHTPAGDDVAGGHSKVR